MGYSVNIIYIGSWKKGDDNTQKYFGHDNGISMTKKKCDSIDCNPSTI